MVKVQYIQYRWMDSEGALVKGIFLSSWWRNLYVTREGYSRLDYSRSVLYKINLSRVLCNEEKSVFCFSWNWVAPRVYRPIARDDRLFLLPKKFKSFNFIWEGKVMIYPTLEEANLFVRDYSKIPIAYEAVSYTHLTLPTIYSV